MSKRSTKKSKSRKRRKKNRVAGHKACVTNKEDELHVEFCLKGLVLYWTSTVLVSAIGVSLAGSLIYKILVPSSDGQVMYSLQKVAYGCIFLVFGFIMFVYGIVITYRMIMTRLMPAKNGHINNVK